MNHSTFDPDDEKLTAFALDELPEEADRAAIERLLADSPEARGTVAEIRSLAASLVAEYETERQEANAPGVLLDESKRDKAVAFSAQKPAHQRRWSLTLLKLAASIVILAVFGFALVPAFKKTSKRVAFSDAKQPAPAGTDAIQTNANPPVAAVQSAQASPTPPVALLALNEAKPGKEFALPEGSTDSNVPASPRLSLQSGAPEKQAYLPAPREPSRALSLSPPTPADAPGSPRQDTGSVVASPLVASAVSAKAASEASRRRFAMRPSPSKDSAAIQGAARAGLALNDESAFESRAASAPASASVGGVLDGEAQDRTHRDAASPFNTATYDHIAENPFLSAKENPLSTFSIDVDTASYANVRRFIEGGALPPVDAVRIEELLNYFPYNDAPPAEGDPHPFALHLEAAACPWNPEHRLARIAIKGREMAADKRPASNLVFLIDVSGSMMPPERLPLIKEGLRLLVEKLTENDHVAIVVYAGNSGLALPSTGGDHKDKILDALGRLEAGGSTNGADGIQLAYKVAREGFIKGGVNRVILATDGDFNVGITSQGELIRLIEKEAKSGVFLSALGVGTDNYKDSTMQKLADRGNGNYAYIDRLEEARKVLVEQMTGTLVTIAKDVKIQVEFNPAAVASYRLIGYEKRLLRNEDFNNDKIDAGEIGAGHSVTALYEIIPTGTADAEPASSVDALKYQSPAPAAKPVETGSPAELLTVKMRYKAPDAEQSQRAYEQPLLDHPASGDFAKASTDFKFSAAVAGFGLALRDSPYKGSITLGGVVELAQDGKGADASGYRAQFIGLVRRAEKLKDR